MATDTTASSYWLNWRVLVCGLILLAPLIAAAILIWRFEGKRRNEREESSPGTLFNDEAWNTSVKRINPLWLLIFRLFSFLALLSLLIANCIQDGTGIFYFYTQWTFTLVTVYFGYAMLLSVYGCCFYNKEAGGNIESYSSIDDAEQGSYRPPSTIDEVGNAPKSSNTPTHIPTQTPTRELAGLSVYLFQILFQTCAGAVVLTDIVFWCLLFPFTKGYKLDFLDVCMHSLNAVFLLGDLGLNSLRFPWFRISYFVIWSCIFVAYQWIIHAFKNLWWPYQFLDLSSPYAPLWYFGVAVMHVPCFGFFALMIKLKTFLIQRQNL